jgi:hypothetical protein
MSTRSLLIVCLLLVCGAARGAEITTNGVVGGAWFDPATWRGKAVPGPGDDVVIRKHDVVTFDRSGTGKVTCRKLLIDPKGGLTFKPGAGRIVFAVADGIESFGAIRLDATRSPVDDFELRLAGPDKTRRHIKLGRGGALLLFGRPGLPGGRSNVALAGSLLADPKEDPTVLVEAEGAVMIDWLRARLADIKLVAKKIDNTGAKPNERIKVSDCVFAGAGRVHCENCDTPEIVRNTFTYEGATLIDEAAVSAYVCQLPEIKGNVIRGLYGRGIALNAATDAVVIDNTVEKCAMGIQGGYGVPNVMIKQATLRGCDVGLKMEGATGVVEDTIVEGAKTAYHQMNSTLQLTSFRVKALDKKGLAVLHEGGALTLLNSNILPGQIKVVPQPPPAGKPPPVPVTCLHYLVVAVKGATPGALIEVRTSSPAPAAGAADPNVRNTPAPVVDGLTPLPRTLTGLVVKAWTIDPAGKLLPPPKYAVKVLGPAPKEAAARPLLKALAFRPPENAFRAEPDDRTPTLEVSLK